MMYKISLNPPVTPTNLSSGFQQNTAYDDIVRGMQPLTGVPSTPAPQQGFNWSGLLMLLPTLFNAFGGNSSKQQPANKPTPTVPAPPVKNTSGNNATKGFTPQQRKLRMHGFQSADHFGKPSDQIVQTVTSLNDPLPKGKLSKEQYEKQMAQLQAARDWYKDKGYVHKWDGSVL